MRFLGIRSVTEWSYMIPKYYNEKILMALFFYKDFFESTFMAPTDEFCENLRLFCQFWENMNDDKIVGYCRKNLLKPVKLRRKDICQCITNKIEQKSQTGNTQPNSMTIVI